jgi:predicted DNA-binding WGR domain protein
MFIASFTDILNAAADGRAFCIRYEYCGYNDKTSSGVSEKFWCYERPHNGGQIQVRFGKIGTSGQTRNQGLSIWDARDRASKKEAKGYRHHSSMAEAEFKATRPALPPLSQWAATMPAPFNTITAIDSGGRALNASGQLVCQMATTDANNIRAQYSA